MDPHELRRLDFTLSDDHQSVREAFADFFGKESPSALVRAAQPLGFDARLWSKIVEIGATAMAMPEEADGDGAGILEMTLVAEELGRALAPIPLLEHVAASRLLAATGNPAVTELVADAVAGERILGLALRPLLGRQLVSTAAVADDIVAFDGEGIVIVSAGTSREHVITQSSLPAAWVDPTGESVVRVTTAAPAALFARAQREWKAMTAAALVGMTEAALALGVEFVKTRETMGVVIGTLQGVSFQLADVRIGVAGARNYARRAAWLLDHEPDTERHAAAAAFAYAAKVATEGTTISAHVQGGLGFTVEADASLYFLRAKGWSLAGGPVTDDVRDVGASLLAARAAATHDPRLIPATT